MTSPSTRHSSDDRQARIVDIVADCLGRYAGGADVDANHIEKAYPDLMPELADVLARAIRQAESVRSDVAATNVDDDHHDDETIEPTDPHVTLDPPGARRNEPQNIVRFDQNTAVLQIAGRHHLGPNHRLLRLHAEGGLGRVWLAHDKQLNRNVALKEMQNVEGQTTLATLTFLKEAQVTAQLEHPNIVPVYQLGMSQDKGTPYYTMRMIDGDVLSKRIAAYHQAQLTPTESALALRRLLNALIDVCNAVAFAHDRGVVHRDLKPLNVVLGEFGEVILLDWGLAKLLHQPGGATKASTTDQAAQRSATGSVALTDETAPQQTAAGSILGTPAYMAPEQAQGSIEDIGPHTDIYGLGAILFEILTGLPPHRAKKRLKSLTDIATEPAPRSHAINESVPRGLDAICAKALATDKHKRYSSAIELANDLERWLADQAVSVYRDPLHVKLLRWARRHKAFVSAATVLVLTVLVALSITTVLVRREQQRTESEFHRADKNFRLALAAVDEMLTEVGQEELSHVPQMEIAQRSLLERALSFYRHFLDEKPEDASLRLETAKASHRVAEILRMLGEHDEAEAEFENAIALLNDLVREFPQEHKYQQQLANSQNYLGELHRQLGNLEGAKQAYTQAQKIQSKLVKETNQPDIVQELARTHYNLGLVYEQDDHPEDAEMEFRQAVSSLNGLVDREHRNEYRQDLARARINLGALMKRTGRSSAAEMEYEEAVNLLSELLDDVPENRTFRRELAAAYNNLGNLLLEDAQRRAEAGQAYDRGRELLEALVRDYRNVPLYQQELGNSLNSIGGFHFFGGNKNEAKESWERARGLFSQLGAVYPMVPEFQSKLGATEGNLGWLAMEEQDLPEAQRLLNDAIRHQRSALKANPRNPTYQGFLRNHYRSLSETLLRQGDHAGAAMAALDLQALSNADWRTALRAAALSARCVELVQDDQELSEDQRAQLENKYTSQTVKLLSAARDQGLRDSTAIMSNKDFDAVRVSDSFMELLREIDGRDD